MNTSTPSANEEAVEVLKKAKALIADPEHWCRRRVATNAGGDGVPATSPSAVSWCSIGAVSAVTVDVDVKQHAWMMLERAAEEMGFEEDAEAAAACLNDETDHPTVMKMFDRAIALAGGE